MKILIIGGGGREHALAWRLAQSPAVSKIWCAPGNGGMPASNGASIECIEADAGDVAGLAALAEQLRPDLTVVGPEAPLVGGIRDQFETRKLRIVAPSASHARLEGSKIFAKNFMRAHDIPTAEMYGTFDAADEAIHALGSVEWPLVIKADGLCAGKGVLVAQDRAEAEAFIRRMMVDREFGDAGSRVLLEQALRGEELSFIVLADGKTFLRMAPTQDHKRIYDGDRGPNTGGMGAFTTDAMAPALQSVIDETIVRRSLDGLDHEEYPYRGFLYFGLMLTDDGPMVLEYNCRMGDPETQPIMMQMDFDLAAALDAAASGTLRSCRPAWKPGASVCVVMASSGYPGKYEVGKRIYGLAEAVAVVDVAVFHAGTKNSDGRVVTSGGRVLGVTAHAATLERAAVRAYDAVAKINFDGAYYRTDIAAKSIARSAGAGELRHG